MWPVSLVTAGSGLLSPSLLLALALAAHASAGSHRAAEHGAQYLPATLGPEYIDLVTQLQAKAGRRPDFEYRPHLLKDPEKHSHYEWLTRAQLAKEIGTTQSVIARLENADYRGHTLKLLEHIAEAVGRRVTISFTPMPEQVLRAPALCS